jgi:hypothetical protein
MTLMLACFDVFSTHRDFGERASNCPIVVEPPAVVMELRRLVVTGGMCSFYCWSNFGRLLW